VRLAHALVVSIGLALGPGLGAGSLTPLSVPLSAVGFTPISRAPDLTVYKDEEARIVRLAAEGWLPEPPEQVLKALLDYGRQVGRIDRLKESRVLARGPGWLRVYQRLGLPVISDRDFTLLVRWGRDGAVTWIAYRAVADGPPPQPGAVRVSEHEGSWQLKPWRSGSFVRFQVMIDLGGSLPRWLARSGAGKELPRLFASLCGLAGAGREEGRTCSSRRY